MANRLTLLQVRIPMTEPFRISSGVVDSKDSILIRIEREGIVGWGESSPMAGGFYSSDTPESCWKFLSEEAVPRLLESGRFAPESLHAVFPRFRDAPFSLAGLDGALWDGAVQEEGTSFIERLGVEAAPIPSGLAVGIYPSIEELIAACKRYLRDGYKRLKIKIQPGWDIEPLQAVREAFGDIPLMVDANAAYREEHFSVLQQLDAFDLMMIEQPLAAGDLDGHARLQASIATPICFDESADDIEAVRTAVEMKACRIVNLKIQRIGSIGGAVEIHNLCRNAGIPNWMGTMPELGIGALHALYLALLPNCAYPTDVEASQRWFAEDIINPQIEVRNGCIHLPKEHKNRPAPDENTISRYAIQSREFRF